MPTDWPDPPWFDHYVLEDPLPLVVLLALAAVIAFLAGGRLGKRSVQYASAGLLVLAGGVALTGHLVETDREAMLAESRRLVEAARAPFDYVTVENLVDPAFVMTIPDGKKIVGDRDALLAAIKRAERRMNIDSNTVTHHMERLDAPGDGAVYLAIFSNTSGKLGKQAAPTRWILHWKQDATGTWRLTEATWLEVAGKPVTGWMLP